MEAAWQSFKETWGDLHPLSTARRLEALAQLQPLAELQVRQPHAGDLKVAVSSETFKAPQKHCTPACLNMSMCRYEVSSRLQLQLVRCALAARRDKPFYARQQVWAQGLD